MGTHRVQCDTWDEVKIKLWDIIHRELKSLAASTGTPPVWTFDEQDPAIEMFEKYTSMRMNTKMLDPWTSAKDRRYLMKNQHESVLLSVYKYGNEIAIIGQLRDFEDQCIGPAAANRGGAAAEDLHQLMISSLKEKWGRTFTAQDMSWRLWASLVLKKPRPQHEREIAKGPPPNLVTQFRPASNASDQHLQRVQHSVKMAKKAVQGMQAKINHFEQTVQVLQTAIVFMNQMLENHLDVIEAMGEDVEIQPDSIETTAALAEHTKSRGRRPQLTEPVLHQRQARNLSMRSYYTNSAFTTRAIIVVIRITTLRKLEQLVSFELLSARCAHVLTTQSRRRVKLTSYAPPTVLEKFGHVEILELLEYICNKYCLVLLGTFDVLTLERLLDQAKKVFGRVVNGQYAGRKMGIIPSDRR
ncbi:hypothetical protein L916_17468 [Phytophthora nicotianae]|uniref:Uncharacterized protein n=1 Tax=Phytophthora nicotianae TaxID=4792 RepID=W2I7E1_PHYNI|nr:hypothetical protein L916_17468 [Phytophthora nicotianae]